MRMKDTFIHSTVICRHIVKFNFVLFCNTFLATCFDPSIDYHLSLVQVEFFVIPKLKPVSFIAYIPY
jgi:hypothetical protein